MVRRSKGDSAVSSKKAQVFLTKQAAAQRQLDAAIRMTLRGEDELAIHTVAAAAYGIIRQLKKRGELRDRVGLGIFVFANDLASGKIDRLPTEFAETDWLIPIINDIAAAIGRGEIKSEKDVIQRLALINETSHWNKFNYPANFLKHADRDPGEALVLDKVNNELLLMSACSAYIELMGVGTSTWEMIVYGAFLGLEIPDSPPKLKAIAKQPLAKRRRACLSLLRELKARGEAALA
jgi:hypothetical protein